jgi:PAS domain S-box-containing protein
VALVLAVFSGRAERTEWELGHHREAIHAAVTDLEEWVEIVAAAPVPASFARPLQARATVLREAAAGAAAAAPAEAANFDVAALVAQLTVWVSAVGADRPGEQAESAEAMAALLRDYRSSALDAARRELERLRAQRAAQRWLGVATWTLLFASLVGWTTRHRRPAPPRATAAGHNGPLVVGFDTAGRIVEWSPGCEKLFGIAAAEVLGATASELIQRVCSDPLERERCLDGIDSPGRGSAGWEWRLRTPSGHRARIRWLDLSEQVPVAQWARWWLGADASEITPRGTGTERVQRLGEVFELGPGLSFVHDLDGVLLVVNPPLAELLGHPLQAMVQRPLAEFVAAKARGEVEGYLDRLSLHRGDSGVLLAATAAGAERHLLYHSVVVERSGLVYVLNQASDITNMVLARDQLAAKEKTLREVLERFESQNLELELARHRAENANRSKSDFLSSMSHELRTPLNAVLGFSELLADEVAGPLNAEQRDFVEQLRRGGTHLLRLIEDLLDLSRIESGRLELRPELIVASAAVDEALMTVESIARRKGIRLERQVDPDLVVYADRTRLRQILLNLLGNALKFTPSGGSARVEARAEGDFARVAVEDSGIGIALEHQLRVFREFEQVGDPTAGVRESTGLGLAIVQRLVEQHGGAIWLDSALGQGSKFQFRLPRSAAALLAEEARRADRAARLQGPQVPVVLVIGFDGETRSLVAEAVIAADNRPIVAREGVTALRLAQSLGPATIILDLDLPDLDGPQTLMRLRADPAFAKIAILAISVENTLVRTPSGDGAEVVLFRDDAGLWRQTLRRRLEAGPIDKEGGSGG